ncbi:hypothetical protein N0V90_011725 [Kalmusia sp. IMI 367209]|nr:hypothetical protein N0V90_011725 [Kalmusia sp. IMI 367209]
MLAHTLLTLGLAVQAARALTKGNQTDNSTGQCDVEGGYDYVNVTGTLTIPGFKYPRFDQHDWTLYFGIKDIRNTTANKNKDDLLLWIDADDDLDSLDLPYIGCAVHLGYDEKNKKTSTGNIAQGDACKGVFSEKCFNSIQSKAKAAAEAQSSDDHDRRMISDICKDVVQFEDDDCTEEEWLGATGAVTGHKGQTALTAAAILGSLKAAKFDPLADPL